MSAAVYVGGGAVAAAMAAAHNRAEPITWGKCGNATTYYLTSIAMPVGKFFMAVMSASVVSSPIQGWMNPVHTRMAA